MIYVASPYSHPNPAVRRARYMAVAKHTAWWLRQGYPVFSPVVYGHHIAQEFSIPYIFDAWAPLLKSALSSARVLAVLQIDGWDQSVGVRNERRLAEEFVVPEILVPRCSTFEEARKALEGWRKL